MEKTIASRLTEEENKALEAYAQRNGISKNKAVKQLILSADFLDYILKYFHLDRLEEMTHAIQPLMIQELCKQNRSRRAGDPGQPKL